MQGNAVREDTQATDAEDVNKTPRASQPGGFPPANRVPASDRTAQVEQATREVRKQEVDVQQTPRLRQDGSFSPLPHPDNDQTQLLQRAREQWIEGLDRQFESSWARNEGQTAPELLGRSMMEKTSPLRTPGGLYIVPKQASYDSATLRRKARAENSKDSPHQLSPDIIEEKNQEEEPKGGFVSEKRAKKREPAHIPVQPAQPELDAFRKRNDSSWRAAAFQNSINYQTPHPVGKVIDEFIERWPIEFHFWKLLAETVAGICKDEIFDKMKVKCYITHRAKAQSSLRGSIERRERVRKVPYVSRSEIEEDMFDLAGVRITLVFPRDVEEVKSFLERQFGQVEQRFWGLDEDGEVVEAQRKERFIGYRATHFLIKWREPKGTFRTELTAAHIGKTVEIQVTSIIMNAWQEAQHDLIYKQLSGAPSEDEKYLLIMINGLAHAGEVALTQLQDCLKRRIEVGSRAYADEYEVRAWLKRHVSEILRVKWLGQGPYMQRLSALFDVLQIFDLKTPEKLQQALEVHLDTDLVLGESKIGFVKQLMDAFQSRLDMEASAEKWRATFRDEVTEWAILKICTHRCAIRVRETMSNLHQDRLKAFIVINTINFALSEDRAQWISDVLIKVFSPHVEYGAALIDSLFILLTADDSEAGHEQHGINMEMIWTGLLRVMVDAMSIFLRVGLALSYSGIVVIPAVAHPDFSNKEANRLVIWPGSRPYKAENLFGGCITIAPHNSQPAFGNQLDLDDLAWTRQRISLQKIAEGKGWFQAGPPIGTLPISKLRPTPLDGSRSTPRFENLPETSAVALAWIKRREKITEEEFRSKLEYDKYDLMVPEEVRNHLLRYDYQKLRRWTEEAKAWGESERSHVL